MTEMVNKVEWCVENRSENGLVDAELFEAVAVSMVSSRLRSAVI